MSNPISSNPSLRALREDEAPPFSVGQRVRWTPGTAASWAYIYCETEDGTVTQVNPGGHSYHVALDHEHHGFPFLMAFRSELAALSSGRLETRDE
jgi:hypothetical protein